jgi:hypothetical protein
MELESYPPLLLSPTSCPTLPGPGSVCLYTQELGRSMDSTV